MEQLDHIQADYLAAMAPPERLSMVAWAETNIYLSPRESPVPGLIRLSKQQRGILETIDGGEAQFITVLKSARAGLTTIMTIVIAYVAAHRASNILLIQPRELDCRNIAIDIIGPVFENSPTLRGLINQTGMGWNSEPQRDTMLQKNFTTGANLKIMAMTAPANLRGQNIRHLLIDETDAAKPFPAEGDPMALAAKRTEGFPDRLIIMASTPTGEETGFISQRYSQGDRRIFELPCPDCGTYFELLWEHISWPEGRPHEAVANCPHCGVVIEERDKRALVEQGRWRATRPYVTNHASFRLNALISSLANARWGLLAEEYLQAQRDGPARIQVFENTTLGISSTASLDSIVPSSLAARAESYSLTNLPPEVLMLTCGIDTQGERLELCVIGWSETGQPFILSHRILFGSTIEDQVWDDLDQILKTKFMHPSGIELPLEAVAIDSGGTGGRTQKVYTFTRTKAHRRIYAIKGIPGRAANRPMWQRSLSRNPQTAHLHLVKVDEVKDEVFDRLAALPYLDKDGVPTIERTGVRNNIAFRLSNTLGDEFIEQLTNERIYKSYGSDRREIHRYKPIRIGARVEALDITCARGPASVHARQSAVAGAQDGGRLCTEGRRFCCVTSYGRHNG